MLHERVHPAPLPPALPCKQPGRPVPRRQRRPGPARGSLPPRHSLRPAGPDRHRNDDDHPASRPQRQPRSPASDGDPPDPAFEGTWSADQEEEGQQQLQ